MDRKSVHVRLWSGLFAREELLVRDGFVRYRRTGLLEDALCRVPLMDIDLHIDRKPSGEFNFGALLILGWFFFVFLFSTIQGKLKGDIPAELLISATIAVVFAVAIIDQLSHVGRRQFVLYHRNGKIAVQQTRATCRLLAQVRKQIRDTQRHLSARTAEQATARAWVMRQLDELREDNTVTAAEYDAARCQVQGISREAGFTVAGGNA